MATGVLPILLGKATKLSKYLIEHDKTYETIIKLGIKTTTGDTEGEILEKKEVKEEIWDNNYIEKKLKKFLGESYQIPPMYSAIKINGKKLYEYARDGVEIERKRRKIHIYNIELLESNKTEKEIRLKVKCSKGTYIRTLCEDISLKLNTVGHMKELKRTEVDLFDIRKTVTLEKLKNMKNKEDSIISIEDYYTNYNKLKKIQIDDKNKLRLFLNGNDIKYNLEDDMYLIYSNNKFLGTGIIQKNRLKRDVII